MFIVTYSAKKYNFQKDKPYFTVSFNGWIRQMAHFDEEEMAKLAEIFEYKTRCIQELNEFFHSVKVILD